MNTPWSNWRLGHLTDFCTGRRILNHLGRRRLIERRTGRWFAELLDDPSRAPLERERDTLLEPVRSKLYDDRVAMLPPEIQTVIRKPERTRSVEEQKIADDYFPILRIDGDKIDEVLTEDLRKKDRELRRRIDDLTQAIRRTNAPVLPIFHTVEADPDRAREQRYILTSADPSRSETNRPVNPGWPFVRGTIDFREGRVEAFADWLTSPDNPLFARVAVNRLWQWHFGEGLHRQPSDFGHQAGKPSHPELLDWLSATFVENQWSIKSMHRLIVLSASYQQSSAPNPSYVELDPNNKYLWRYNLRRMDFEELHDSLLVITGELDRTRGGQPVAISSEAFAKRRSVYTMIDRTNPPELLTQFDFPSPDVSSGRRYETLVPQQALFLMNSPMVIETARKLVDRPAFADLKTDDLRVTSLYLAIFQRWPTKTEVDIGLRYVKANPTGQDVVLSAALPAAKASTRDARMAEKKAKAPKASPKFNPQVGGVFDNRPLDAWAKLAHALFQSNEAMFYN